MPAEAERRQLTVMFCDLVGSTALSGALDPEDMREVVRAYHRACAEVINRLEGHIAQYLGDGLLVYFGYPRAHEDDAQRAVRAALGIVGALERLNTPLRGDRDARLALRVGIHTGLVVVGEVGSGTRHEHLALGETPNLAARLQAIAEPNTVVISSATQRLVEHRFACQDLGFHTAKGVSMPLRAYRVLQERDTPAGFDAVSTGLTALVGRDQEVELLLSRWEQVKDGFGQVVLLNGEAGIGKSRLLRELRERVANEPYTRWECRCSPYHQESALYPMIDLFQRALEFARDDSPEDKLRKIEDGLRRYGLSDHETVALWAALLSVPLPTGAPLNLTPQRQKQRTVGAILGLLVALAARQPVLVVIEDLHWVDPSTLELLNLLVEQAPTARVFVLLTFRPDFRPPWAPRSYVTYLTLNRLSRRQTELMVGRAAGGKGLPIEVVQEVVAKTDGVPLFVEELTKMVLESGLLRSQDDRYEVIGALPPLAIPSTLQDSLMARLDRLATVKEVAQIGAALGRTFHYELLRAVASLDEATLERALARLCEAELLHQRGVAPDVTYIFKHALIQETAYQSMLISRRQQLHKRIADTLVERFLETTGTQPELVAHHYTEADLAAPAVDYWARAGQRAAQRSAYAETIAHLRRALELLKTLPDTAERTRQEQPLDVQTALGPALIASRGFAAAEVERAYARARELCQQVGETPQLFPVVWALWAFYLVRADLRTADELAEQLLRLARSAQDPALLVPAHRALGTHFHFQGEFVRAQEHQTQGIALYDPQQQRCWAYHVEQHPGVVCRCFAAHHLWYLGYPDRALKSIQDALALAQELAHPYSVMHSVDFAAWLHLYRREGRLTQERAESDMAHATEQQMAFFLTHATIFRGWALVEQGHGEEGLSQIREGISAYRATGAEIEIPYWLGLLAEACGKVGRAAEGLPIVAEAIAEVHNKGWRFCEAELFRLKGELLLALAAEHRGEAEVCFHQALAASRRQHAKSLELRAATSLSRLWQREGRRAEARHLLAEVYGWFTEGFETPDLKEAKALLDELA